MSHPPYSRLAAALILLAPALAGCGQGQPPGSGPPPPPTVTVAKPVERGIVDQDEYVGRFVAVDSVEVRARVSGYLDQIHFRDGQMVKQGDLLFTIDKRPFQNTVAQARGTLAQAKANLAFAEADLERAKQLGARELAEVHAQPVVGGGIGGGEADGIARGLDAGDGDPLALFITGRELRPVEGSVSE